VVGVVTRGVYRLNYRGYSLAECWRLGGPMGLGPMLFWRLVGKRGDYLWLPAPEYGIACPKEQLTRETQEQLEPLVRETERLGYTRGMFWRPVRVLDHRIRDGGEYWALHEDGQRVLSAHYTHAEDAPGCAVTPERSVTLFGLFLTQDLRGTLIGTDKHL
jgi:hypothetical protein